MQTLQQGCDTGRWLVRHIAPTSLTGCVDPRQRINESSGEITPPLRCRHTLTAKCPHCASIHLGDVRAVLFAAAPSFDSPNRRILSITETPPGIVNPAVWNAGLSKRHDRLRTRTRQAGFKLEAAHGIHEWRSGPNKGVRHIHSVFIIDGIDPAETDECVAAWIKSLAIEVGFGPQFTVKPIRTIAEFERACAYATSEVPKLGECEIRDAKTGKNRPARLRSWGCTRGWSSTSMRSIRELRRAKAATVLTGLFAKFHEDSINVNGDATLTSIVGVDPRSIVSSRLLSSA